MMDDIRVDFRKLNGHWFVSVGSKGYACTSEFEEKNSMSGILEGCI